MDRDTAGDLQPFNTSPSEARRVVEEETGAKHCPSCDLTYDHESWCPERIWIWRKKLSETG